MDEQVKQRLVGAIILAVCGLLLIPWLFGDPKDPRASIHASFAGTPLPQQPADEQDEIVLNQSAATQRPTATATPRRFLSPAKTPSPRPSNTPAPQVTTAPAPAAQAWLLQLISYNSKKSADDFRARLRKDGLVAYREEVTVSNKTYYRVRLKVQGNKSRALKLKQQLEDKYRIQARLLPYKNG